MYERKYSYFTHFISSLIRTLPSVQESHLLGSDEEFADFTAGMEFHQSLKFLIILKANPIQIPEVKMTSGIKASTKLMQECWKRRPNQLFYHPHG